jgi:Domain of unknown function (DUF4160)
MAKVVIPLDKTLLDDLAEDMLAYDSRQANSGRRTLLVEWTVPRMPKSLKGEIRSKEHPPPHFHVMCDDDDVGFSILDGTRLRGETGLERYDQVIKAWWQKHERELCLTWNKSRPTDCTVGLVPVPAVPQSN